MTCSYLKPRHRSVVDMVGHALTLSTDVGTWRGLTTILDVRLSSFERGCLAAAALDAAADEEVFRIVDTVVPKRLAGAPLPHFLDGDAEAAWWADLASPPELRTFLSACFVRLRASEQVAFLDEARRAA